MSMEYLLMLYDNEAEFAALTPQQQHDGVAAYVAYTQALEKAGALRGANRLGDSSSATTVRMSNGRTQVQNGPFAESREQLGGYYLIDVPDLDAAIAWAARCPSAQHGIVEVRPVWTQ
jgi:hypothetical protein